MLLAVTPVDEPVPPFPVGNIPVTLDVKLTASSASLAVPTEPSGGTVVCKALPKNIT